MYKPRPTESKLLRYQKYVDLIEYGYKLLIKYPKYEKYALVSEIRRNMYQSLKYILYANEIANHKLLWFQNMENTQAIKRTK